MNPQRLTVEEAAARLGVSVRTVRRRIHTKELQAEQEPLAQGFRWWVLLDVPELDVASHDQDSAPASETSATAALLAEVTAERDWLRGQVDELTRQAGNYQVLLLQSQEKIRLLEAGHTASQDINSASTAASQTSGQQDDLPGRRPWWRRLLGGSS